MNPENPSRPEIEAKLTALLLGELPEEEARLLRYTIGQDAELQKLHDRLKLTIGLVREVQAKPTETAPLKLSDERRKKLLAHFKTPRQPETPWIRQLRIPSLIEVLVVVAIVVMLAALLLPALSKAKYRAKNLSIRNELRMQELQKQMDQEENPAPAATPPPQQPNGGTTTGGVYSENFVGYVNVNKTSSATLPVAAPAPPPTVIVLPNAGPTENRDLAESSSETQTTSGRQTHVRRTQNLTVISGVSPDDNQAAAPMSSTPPTTGMPVLTENGADVGSTQMLAYNFPTEAPKSETGAPITATVQMDADSRKLVIVSDKKTQESIANNIDTFQTQAGNSQAPMAQIQHPRTRSTESPVPETAPVAAMPPGNYNIELPQMASDSFGGASGGGGSGGGAGGEASAVLAEALVVGEAEARAVAATVRPQSIL